MKRVYVTGMGVISAIGNNLEENLDSLRSGNSGIRAAEFLESKYKDTFKFGEVNRSNDFFAEHFNIQDKSGVTRTEYLARTAFEEAVNHSCLSTEELSNFETGFISASTVGGMSETEHLYSDANQKDVGSEFLCSYRSGAHTLRMAKHYKIKGYTDTINTACSSSANAIMLGVRLIKSGKMKRMIVGGTESLAKYAVNGFNALQILSKEATTPFDKDRIGLSLGEGAAYIVLESEELCKEKERFAEVSGYGNANDAYHPSSMSPEATGVVGAISQALETANLKPDEIDHINTHGTGTQNNDYTELLGFTKIFNDVPPFVSTKSYTGHTLGAAGALEAVFSILCIQNNELYPSLQFKSTMDEFDLSPLTEYKKGINVNHVLSNSFGFGGNCSSLIISKA